MRIMRDGAALLETDEEAKVAEKLVREQPPHDTCFTKGNIVPKLQKLFGTRRPPKLVPK